VTDLEKLQRRYHFHSNNKGFTLVGVLIVLVILSVLGLSILMITSNFVKLSVGERDDQSVFYIAEAGIVDKLYEINETVDISFKTVSDELTKKSPELKKTFNFVKEFNNKILSEIDTSTPTIETFKPSFGEESWASVTVENTNINPPEYEIVSVGIIGNKKRTVTQSFSVILTTNDGGDDSASGLPGFPVFPEFAKLPLWTNKSNVMNLDKDYYLSDLNVASLVGNYGGTLTINVGDADRILLVDNFKIDNGTKIIIEGTGTLKLYVVNNVNIGGGAILNAQNSNEQPYSNTDISQISEKHVRKLEIYTKGTNFQLDNQGKFYGSIYVENGNVNVQGSGNMYGNVFSGGSSVKIQNSGKILGTYILAPTALADIGQSGLVRGTLISASLHLHNGGKVEDYKPFISGGFFYPGSGNTSSPTGTPEIVKKARVER